MIGGVNVSVGETIGAVAMGVVMAGATAAGLLIRGAMDGLTVGAIATVSGGVMAVVVVTGGLNASAPIVGVCNAIAGCNKFGVGALAAGVLSADTAGKPGPSVGLTGRAAPAVALGAANTLDANSAGETEAT